MTRRNEFWKIVLFVTPWIYTFTLFLVSCTSEGKAEHTENTAFVMFWVIFGLLSFIAIITTILRRTNERFRNYWLDSDGSILQETPFYDISQN